MSDKATICAPWVTSRFTTDPREPGERYTIKYGNGVKESRIVLRVKPITDVELLEGGFSEVSQIIFRTDPPDPCSLSCCICDEPVGDRRWRWAAMWENGPVHTECFMTDEELRAELDDVDEPCDHLAYCDGVNNCDIVRDPDGGPHLIY